MFFRDIDLLLSGPFHVSTLNSFSFNERLDEMVILFFGLGFFFSLVEFTINESLALNVRASKLLYESYRMGAQHDLLDSMALKPALNFLLKYAYSMGLMQELEAPNH